MDSTHLNHVSLSVILDWTLYGWIFFTIFQTTKITLHSCFQKKISHPTNSKVLNKWIFYGYWNYSLIYHFGNVWKTTLEPRFHLGELASDAARCEIPPPRCERVLGGDLFGSGEKKHGNWKQHKLVGGFSATHLKNMLFKLDHFPNFRGEHKKY